MSPQYIYTQEYLFVKYKIALCEIPESCFMDIIPRKHNWAIGI